MLSRRTFVTSAGALLASGCASPAFNGAALSSQPASTRRAVNAPPAEPQTLPAVQQPSDVAALQELEARVGGRVGVFAFQPSSGKTLAYRADEHFAMCSTFKWALAGAVLLEIDRQRLSLAKQLAFTEADLLEYAPVTRTHLAEGSLTVEALLQACVSVSDNTAANLLLTQLGGPPAVTRFFRELGDTVSRLDRNEPLLNMNTAGDEQDTTSPRAMTHALEIALTSNLLTSESRGRLQQWLVESTTGLNRLRAGLPSTWRAGDKTGTGNRGACNDVAILWPPSAAPWFVAAYLSDSDTALETLSAAHGDIARLVVAREDG
jgi:beta-lactamase class A